MRISVASLGVTLLTLLECSTALTTKAGAETLNLGQPGKRPEHRVWPHHPGKAFPTSPPRNRTCIVQSYGDGQDDAGYVLDAIWRCNNGGHVVFEAERKYIIGRALDLTFLTNIDLGTLHFTGYQHTTSIYPTFLLISQFQLRTPRDTYEC
jgi:galacturan 1,4-alpha-galacturonidase